MTKQLADPAWLATARPYIGQREISGPHHNPHVLKWWKDIGYLRLYAQVQAVRVRGGGDTFSLVSVSRNGSACIEVAGRHWEPGTIPPKDEQPT